MRVAVLCYHKNAEKIYPKEWIEKFKETILNQSYSEFDILECNYGGGEFRIFDRIFFDYFVCMPFKSFAHCLNYLLEMCFVQLKYDYVFNTNCDDYYALNWIEKELEVAKQGYDIVSSNFCLVKNDEVILTHKFDEMDIKEQLDKNHNIICHPSVCYSKNFGYNNRYNPDEIPFEDMKLWQRSLSENYKFEIVPDVLVYHRLHENSIGHNLKEQ